MVDTFIQRKIDLTFTLEKGTFGAENSNTLKLSGLRVLCRIQSSGLDFGTVANLRIEGMTLSQMNALSKIVQILSQQGGNTVLIEAGDDQSGMAAIFTGGITEAFADFDGSPNVAFQVTAMTNSIPQATSVTPTTFPPGARAADVLAAIAKKGGLDFENNGVTQVFAGDTYCWGDVGAQISRCAQSLKLIYSIQHNKLSIWPSNFNATGTEFVVSASTGMVGYPAYNAGGVVVRTLFNRQAKFMQAFKLESDFAPAAWSNQPITNPTPGQSYSPSDGTWITYNLEHNLASETMDGPWFTTLMAARPDFAGGFIAK